MKNEQLLGKWQVACWSANLPGGWNPFRNFAPGEYLWEFLPDGVLLTQGGDEAPEKLTYEYDPAEHLLTTTHFGKEERYRVEFSNQNHLILYDLEEVEVEPDDYSLRVELGRIS